MSASHADGTGHTDDEHVHDGTGADVSRNGSWRRARRLLTVVLTLVVTGIALAPAAGADGVRPSNYVSVIDSVEPSTDTVQVEILGGDSFFQVTADPGTEVSIPGYDGEPYLRILADGRVQQNERSPATYLNVSRNAQVNRFPDEVSSSADPQWRTIASGGQVAWHDHRIHWMLPDAPEVGAGGVVQTWELPMQVDGADVVVTGRLLHRGDVLPWAALVGVATTIGATLLARRDRLRVPLLLGASVLALGLSASVWVLNPPGAEPNPLPLVLPALAIVVLGLALVPRLSAGLRGMVLPLVGVAALAGWAIPQIGVIWMPTVPTVLAGWVVRLGTGLVLGTAVGVAIAILLRPVPVPVADPAAAATDPDLH